MIELVFGNDQAGNAISLKKESIMKNDTPVNDNFLFPLVKTKLGLH